MKESTTYQGIIEEGRSEGAMEEARRLLLQLGKDHFQLIPNKKAMTALNEITDLRKLERLALRVSKTETWEQLLGLPEPKR